MQASKTFPQLAEHAARIKCSPSSEFGKFMHDVISRKSAPSYDNVIATSDWLSDKDEDAEDKVRHGHQPHNQCWESLLVSCGDQLHPGPVRWAKRQEVVILGNSKIAAPS